jgi:hypothetical protein
MQAQEAATSLAAARDQPVAPEHLLIALLDQGTPEVIGLLSRAGLDRAAVRRAALAGDRAGEVVGGAGARVPPGQHDVHVLSSPGRPSGDTASRNKVSSDTPGRSPPRETTITKCRPSALAKGSPPTAARGVPAGTGIATEPVTCPSAEARTVISSPATTT